MKEVKDILKKYEYDASKEAHEKSPMVQMLQSFYSKSSLTSS